MSKENGFREGSETFIYYYELFLVFCTIQSGPVDPGKLYGSQQSRLVREGVGQQGTNEKGRQYFRSLSKQLGNGVYT